MKKLLLTAFAVSCAASVFAQGTVIFNNRLTGTLVTRVYYSAGAQSGKVGNGTDDTPAGSTSWTGYTGLTGSGWMAAILNANGAGVNEALLTFGATPTTTTFRAGVNAGGFANINATLGNVPADAGAATLEVFVWNSAQSGLTDPTAALALWRTGTTAWAGGLSGAFTVNAIGGSVNTAPALAGLQSFSVYAVPEPATMALAGLGAAALLIFRRRK